MREFDLEHIRIRTCHPESNGKVERFHRSTRESLDNLPPAEYGEGRPEARKHERRQKLERGRRRRERINRQRLQMAA